MPVSKITKSTVDRMGPWTVLWDSEVKGFGCRRHGTEGRHYLLRYRFDGRQTFRKIGRHGSPWTPDTARSEALRLLGQVVSGTNPSAVRRAGDAFAGELDRFLAHKRNELKPSSFINVEMHLRKQAAPLHPVELARIDRRAIAQVLAGIERDRGPVARNRLRSSLSAFFEWLVREGLLDVNPVSGTGKATEGGGRDRVLTNAELSAVWSALGDDDAGDIIRLLTLTGQRKEEINGLHWSEIDFDRALIVLPPARTKNGLRHEVPLSPMALAILRKRWSGDAGEGNDGPVFPSLGWSHAKTKLDAKLALAPWRIHDLRRTCATGIAELGVLPHIVEAVLNHVSGHKAGVAGTYNRARYEAETRNALELWASHIEKITLD